MISSSSTGSFTKDKRINNDFKRLNLYGNVKSVREIPYEALEKFGDVTKGKLTAVLGNNFSYHFTKKGNTSEHNSLYIDGSLISKNTYKYDEKGNRIEEINLSADGAIKTKSIYEYNDRGNVIESTYNNTDEKLIINQISKYEFDNQKNWVKLSFYKNKILQNVFEREIEYY